MIQKPNLYSKKSFLANAAEESLKANTANFIGVTKKLDNLVM